MTTVPCTFHAIAARIWLKISEVENQIDDAEHIDDGQRLAFLRLRKETLEWCLDLVKDGGTKDGKNPG